MDAPSTWFLVSGLLVLFVGRCIRGTRQQLALRRGLATAGAAAASAAPGAPIGVRGAA